MTIPTVTRPTLTIPTVTRPTLTIPTIPHFDSAVTLTSVKGVGKTIETKLKAAGITTVEALASASPKDVARILGYQDSSRAKVLIDDAAKLID
jgi:predicted flap endonuclease-1-like 5' DNA nuclease